MKKANRDFQHQLDDEKQSYEKKISELKKENVRLTSSATASELASPRTPRAMPTAAESSEIAERALAQVAKLMEENGDLEISLEEYKSKVAALESQGKAFEKEVEELRARAEEADSLKSENASLRQGKEQLEEELRERESGAHERQEMEKLTAKVAELEEERKSFVAEKMRLENDLTDARDAGDEMDEEVNRLTSECKNLRDEIDDLQEELDDKDEELRRLELALERSMEDLKKVTQEKADLEVKKEDNEVKTEDKKEDKKEDKEEDKKEVKDDGKCEEDVKKFKDELAKKDEEIEKLKSMMEERDAELAQTKSALEQYKLDVSDLEEEADEYEARISKLKGEIQDLTDDMDDYKDAAEAARKASDELRARVATAEKAVEDAARKAAERDAAADADRAQLAGEVRRLKQEVLRTHIAVAAQKTPGGDVQRLQETVADLEAACDELKAANIKLKRDLLDAQDDLQDAEDRCKAADGRCAALDKEVAAMEDAMAGAAKRGDSERAALAARVEELERAAKEAAARCDEHTKAAKREIEEKNREIERLKEELAAAKSAGESSVPSSSSDSVGEDAAAPQQRVLLTGLRRTAAHPRRRAPTSSSSSARRSGTSGAGGEDEETEDGSGGDAVSPKMAAKDMEGAVAVLPMAAGGVTLKASLRKSAAAAVSGDGTTDPSKIKRLVQIKGRRNVRSFLVEPVSASLNSGDVFVLELVDRVFQWNGAKCNRLERSKGVDLATRISRTHGGFGRVITIEEGDAEPDDAYIFWRELGPKAAVKSADEGGDDAQTEAAVAERTHLYSVDAATGELAPVEAQQRLLYEMLDPTQCYVLDCVSEVYAWVGKSSPAALRSVAVEVARTLRAGSSPQAGGVELPRPPYAEFFRCNAGGEVPLFTDKFANWPGEATLGNAGHAFSYTNKGFARGTASTGAGASGSGSGGHHQQMRIQVEPLIDAEPPVPDDDVDDGDDGTVKVWRIVEASKVEVPDERFGQFWSKNAYVVLYSYGAVDKSHIIYFWLGAEASKTEMGTAAATALNLSKVYRGASQVRVVQGMEPTHFLKLFREHSFIIHTGRDDPSKKQTASTSKSGATTRMYQIRGSELADTRTIEVPPLSAYLTTADTFILIVPDKQTYILHGTNSCEYIRTVASTACTVLLKGNEEPVGEPTVVKQGEEPEEFWAALDAKRESGESYPDAKNPLWAGRMFAFTNKTGVVTAEPMWKFAQVDLAPSLMFLLDAWDTVFLWIGPKAKENEKKPALECAWDYAEVVAKRQPERGTVQALIVEQGKEPLEFSHYFVGWKFPQNSAATAAKMGDLKLVKEALEAYDKKYTIEELRNKAALPPTVDKSRLEEYLSDEDFAKVFGITREQYLALPQWQRTPKKKAAGLF